MDKDNLSICVVLRGAGDVYATCPATLHSKLGVQHLLSLALSDSLLLAVEQSPQRRLSVHL